MAGVYHMPEGGSHPSLYAANPVAKMSSPTDQGSALDDYFAPLSQRLHEVMSTQYIPKTDETLASLLRETNLFVASTTRLNIENYDGWLRDILPLKEAPATFFRARVWNLIPQAMEDNPEGVVPQVMMHQDEDYWFALRRFSIGNKAKHASLFDAEGLKNWILKQGNYPSAFFRTCVLVAIHAITHHQSSYARQMHAQGRRIFTSVGDALTWETETYLVGLSPNGLTKLAMMANQMLKSSAPDQDEFNRIVLPFGAKQREAFSKFQSTPERRGPPAVANIEGGGKSWESAGLPGFVLWEAGKLNYVNFGNDFEPLERQSTISTYFVLEGRSALKYAVDKYDPGSELSVMVRDARTAPELNRYGYEEALRDCHRFDEDGNLDRVAHRDMLRQLPTLLNLGSFEMQNLQDLDPFVWHHPTRMVDPSAPGYHICDVYGDVAESFRGHQVDDKHGEAFALLAEKYLGEKGVSAIAAVRSIVARLERPSPDLWTGDKPPIAVWVEAVVNGAIHEGAFDVPTDTVDGIDLPYGFTTIAGIRALARKHNSAPGDWGDEARAMFRVANDAWPVFERLWALVRRVYPECILVSSGRFVPAWMETGNEETNAKYSVLANFFDVVRYPVWWIGGDSRETFSRETLGWLGIDGSDHDERLAALNAGFLDDTIARTARDREGAAGLAKAYRDRIGAWYQRLIQDDVPAADRELETFFAREVDADGLTDGQRGRIASGILALAYEALHAGRGRVQALTRELINSWKERGEPEGRPPVRRVPVDGINSRLSFHPSVWRSEGARAVASVAPADPTQRDRPLPPTEEGFGFARSAMPGRGTYFDPLDTRSAATIDRPMDQDLGSLDELDETQMLYPHLYAKDSNVFWKFDSDLGQHEKTYYLWHRVQHLRTIAPDQFAKLGTLCLLFSSISIQANMACVASRIPPPDLCFMGVHFAIRQRTQGVIIARGNGAAGNMYWKYLDTLVSVNTDAKEWSSHFEAQIGTGITEPRAIMFHRDVYPSGGLTGYDTSSVPRDFTVEHVGLDRSLIVMYTGSEFTRSRARSEANPFPLSGRYDADYMGSTRFSGEAEAKMDDPDTLPYPGFIFYAALHKLQALHSKNKWSDASAQAENRQHRYHPGIVFMEKHNSYSGDRQYNNCHRGTGHTAPWPDDIRGVSEGTGVFYPTELEK